MKNLLRIKAIGLTSLAFTILTSSILFISCSKDPNQSIKDQSTINQLEQEPMAAKPPKFKLKFKGKPHRGAKWANQQEPKKTPCKHSFGICGVGVEIGIELQLINNGGGNFRIDFLEDIGNIEGDIFMSVDDEFIFPSDIAEEFGFSYLEIIPADYVAHMYDNSNLGYVDINCITNE